MPFTKDESPSSTSTNATGPKSKQERIRDNQRRSRARRQEYLADLERRLRESHATNREAELQRIALINLQRENVCLRKLLNAAGVADDVVDVFVRQHTKGAGESAGPSMRELRPKYQMPTEVEQHPAMSAPDASTLNGLLTRQSSGSTPGAQAITPTFPGFDPLQSMSVESAVAAASAESYHDFSPSPDLSWDFDPALFASTSTDEQDGSFCCGTFLVRAQGAVPEDDRNSILCSVAKDLLDQYQIPPQEMNTIKLRLATGFSKPTAPGKGCRINNNLLFSILNEVSEKYG